MRRRAVAGALLLTSIVGCERTESLSAFTRGATAVLASLYERTPVHREAPSPRAVEPPAAKRPAPPATPPEDAPCVATSTHPPPPASKPAGEKKRVYAKTRFVWIRDQPSWSSPWLGYLFPGESVAMKSTRPVYAWGCEVWYEVMPRGYVCVDGKRATLDAEDPDYRAVAAYTPDYSTPVLHHYAESLGAERYERLPSHAEQRAREPDLTHHLKLLRMAQMGEPRDPTLLGVDISIPTEEAVPFESLPVDIQVQRNKLRKDSAIAYTAEFRYDGRSFLLTPDFAWVPKDRVRPYTPAAFRGVKLDGSVKLPLAFFREKEQPKFSRRGPHQFVANGESFPRLAWTALTGRDEISGWDIFLETADGSWIRKTDTVVPSPSDRTPWGSVVGMPDDAPNRPSGRATWIEVSIYGGWLLAYEGTYPVYATLISPGRGGAPHGTKSPTLTASTPVGRFSVSGKFVTATMDAPDGVTHTDVPWTQNFSGPHAIHAAYWHDAWGERVSGGCVNVSPEDGFWLFHFSEPNLPAGWHGVRLDPRFDPSTIVMIHR